MASARARRWSRDEDLLLRRGVEALGKNWGRIVAAFLTSRTARECEARWLTVVEPGLVKGHWSPTEDAVIIACVEAGMSLWSEVAAHVPGRVGKQCRERWQHHLDPGITKAPWTAVEIAVLEREHARVGACRGRGEEV